MNQERLDFLVEETYAWEEHDEFLDEMNKLVEQLVWRLQDRDVKTVHDAYEEVRVFGDEPVFTAMVFERLQKEAEQK